MTASIIYHMEQKTKESVTSEPYKITVNIKRQYNTSESRNVSERLGKF